MSATLLGLSKRYRFITGAGVIFCWGYHALSGEPGQVGSTAVEQPAKQWLDSLTNEVRNLPAPDHPIPLKPTSQKVRPLPNGRVIAEQELQWRVLYAEDPLQRRAAQRVSIVAADPSQLQKYIGEIDQANDQSTIPPIQSLQDPRAIPSLRRALARMKDPMHRYFILTALYWSGDWNHSAELLDLFNNTAEDHSALTLLGTYHPDIATPMCLEIAGLAERKIISKDKRLYSAHVELAFEILEQNKYPGYKQVLLLYFKKWSAPVVAGKLGDYRVTEAEPLIEAASANAAASPYFQTFNCQKFYRYALAQLRDQASVNWMVDKGNMWLRDAPNGKLDLPAYMKWGDEHGGAAPFYDLLVKLGTRESLDSFVKLLVKETRQGVHTISAKSFVLTGDSLAVDGLTEYFAQTGDLEKTWDLTEPKKMLALYAANPKAAALMEEYIPDVDARADLIDVAQEFGVEGLIPQNTFSSFHRPSE